MVHAATCIKTEAGLSKLFQCINWYLEETRLSPRTRRNFGSIENSEQAQEDGEKGSPFIPSLKLL